MRVLFISLKGEGVGLAYRIARDGHDVLLFINRKDLEFCGIGLVNRVQFWRPYLKDVDLCIIDEPGFGQYQSVFKEVRVPVLGCSKLGDIANEDPEKISDLCKRVGIQIPFSRRLHSPSDGAGIITEWPIEGMVVKEKVYNGGSKTTICRDPQTYFWCLSKCSPDSTVTVQEFINGTRISVSGWFNSLDWMTPFMLVFKDKGGSTIVKSKRPVKIIRDTITKITPFLKKMPYRGLFTFDCIVSSEGLFVTDSKFGFTYDLMEAFTEGLTCPLSEFLYQLATSGKDEIDISSDHSISVRLTTPEGIDRADMPIVGLNSENARHMFFGHVFKGDDDIIRYTGSGNIIAKVTARGRDVREASNRVYRTIKNIDYLDKRFNPSVGEFVDRDMTTLRNLGYI